ncbi:MAG: DNA-directed RNA polymerase subunit 8 [Candidatus Korarchaeum sp.]|nr:DNA-directed RNA polymerase subunit 8 [Candidatus Korarchaeum sp.]
MSKVRLSSIRSDPIFDIDILSFESLDKSFEAILEFPKGLINLKEGMEAELTLGEEGEGDIIMKGIVYKVDDSSRTIEISFHGLLMKLTYSRAPPFRLSQGEEVYLTVKFS